MITGCSSITNLDISSIIDKTENWLFENEENNEENNNEQNNQEEFTENEIEVAEEVFPDIAEIPQVTPDFEEIDEDFFDNDNLGTATFIASAPGQYTISGDGNTAIITIEESITA